MLKISTDPRSSVTLAQLRDDHTISDVLDLSDALDFRDMVDSKTRER